MPRKEMPFEDARLSDRLDGYQGNVWWLPLSQETRQRGHALDLCCWNLSTEDYYGLKKAKPKKKPLVINGKNRMAPGMWE